MTLLINGCICVVLWYESNLVGIGYASLSSISLSLYFYYQITRVYASWGGRPLHSHENWTTHVQLWLLVTRKYFMNEFDEVIEFEQRTRRMFASWTALNKSTVFLISRSQTRFNSKSQKTKKKENTRTMWILPCLLYRLCFTSKFKHWSRHVSV